MHICESPLPLSYNRGMRAFMLTIAVLALLGGLCSCEYPEMGHYELVGLDEDGRLLGRQLFIVEEYVDDSEMTTGFGLLLPHVDGEHLVRIPMEPTEGFEARGWVVRTNAKQTGHGNLLLEMTHIGERLKMEGRLAIAGRDSAEEFHASIRSEEGLTSLLFVGAPPALPEAFRGAVDWQLRRLSAESFEALCGLSEDSPVLDYEPWEIYDEAGSVDSKRDQVMNPGPDHSDPAPAPQS